jgi:hypothetical protein
MSYVVSLKRLGDRPISVSEFMELSSEDSSLRKAPSEVPLEPGILELEWTDESGSAPEYFVLHAGEVEVTNPSDRALRKMQELAVRLGARVIGEEGEDLTGVSVPHSAVPSSKSGCAVVLLAVAGALLWFLWR